MIEFIKNRVRRMLTENRVKFNIQVPNDIKLIKDVFIKNGKHLYLVGGSVRDALLGLTPKDYDLVTNAIPDEIIRILKNQTFVKNILETGKAFGVINVITDNDEYEIATFRSDGKYTDSRRPDSVTFGSIDNDALRRDITFNSLYYDLESGEIIDLVGGIGDLKNGVVKTVGNPVDRFEEDPLRILRFLRFVSRI